MPRKPRSDKTKETAATSSTSPESVEVSRRTWDRWQHARAQKAQWEEVEKKARAALEKEIGEAPIATIHGIPVISWKVTEKRNVFDATAHKAEQPECHAAYTVKKDGTRPFNEVEFDPELLEDDDA
jgi:hypothetical protein